MRDEAELIREAARGGREAFDLLVTAKRQQVVRTAYQVTGDLEDARDVAQRVFVRLWRILDRYDPARRFDTWLYRITVNAAIDHLRSRGPKGMIQPLPADSASLGDGGVDPSPGADHAVGRSELQRAFTRLAARLAPKQRAVFVLKEIEGVSTPEVARILGVTESTVRNHLHQARQALRAGLERDYPELVPGQGRHR